MKLNELKVKRENVALDGCKRNVKCKVRLTNERVEREDCGMHMCVCVCVCVCLGICTYPVYRHTSIFGVVLQVLQVLEALWYTDIFVYTTHS